MSRGAFQEETHIDRMSYDWLSNKKNYQDLKNSPFESQLVDIISTYIFCLKSSHGYKQNIP